MTHHRFRHHSVHQPLPIIHPKLRLLLIGSNLWYLGEGLFGPLFAVFTERVGGDILEITWAWAAYLIVTGIAMIIVGKLSDKMIAKEKLMVAGYALNALVTFSYLFVRTPVGALQRHWLPLLGAPCTPGMKIRTRVGMNGDWRMVNPAS